MRYRDLSFWMAGVDDDLTPRAPLPGPRQVDVAVVGAGYTGLWTAYYCPESLIRRQYVAMLARISSAVLVHTNGLGSAFQASIQACRSAFRAATLRWAERRSLRLVNSANQRSTRFSQDEYVGVKCR